MNDIGYQEISILVQNNEHVAIFDRDNWRQQTGQISSAQESQSLKLIKDTGESQRSDQMKKIEKELQHSKENFFTANIQASKTDKKNNLPPLNVRNKLAAISCKKNNAVLKQGSVQKKTDGIIFNWHRRYMVLTSNKVIFFADQNKAEVIGCVNLKLMKVEVIQKKGNLVLDFDGESENIVLKFDSARQRQEWKQWLQNVVKYNHKELKLKIKTIVKNFYTQKDCITQSQFLKEVETGDILLFYTKNSAAKVQRFFTNSQFDHVAMVIKLGNQEPMVFQSNPSYGVCMFRWNEFLYFFNLYQKVTLRKLNYLRKPEAQQSLIQFAKKNLGKKYDIGAVKMMQFESDFDWQKVKQQEKNDQIRGYFCSQLIAKAYKSVGLIESKKSSARYWPVDFGQKSGLMLRKNAFLGPQVSIVLDKHVKKLI